MFSHEDIMIISYLPKCHTLLFVAVLSLLLILGRFPEQKLIMGCEVVTACFLLFSCVANSSTLNVSLIRQLHGLYHRTYNSLKINLQ
jgi:uncharacterized membrane protein